MERECRREGRAGWGSSQEDPRREEGLGEQVNKGDQKNILIVQNKSVWQICAAPANLVNLTG